MKNLYFFLLFYSMYFSHFYSISVYLHTTLKTEKGNYLFSLFGSKLKRKKWDKTS